MTKLEAIATLEKAFKSNPEFYKMMRDCMELTILEAFEENGLDKNITQKIVKEASARIISLFDSALWVSALESDKRRADELELLSSPGDTIKETMEALGIDFPLFVNNMGISAEGAKNLLDGKVPLTEAIARRLELTLNIDAQFWLNLEANYRQKLKDLTKE